MISGSENAYNGRYSSGVCDKRLKMKLNIILVLICLPLLAIGQEDKWSVGFQVAPVWSTSADFEGHAGYLLNVAAYKKAGTHLSLSLLPYFARIERLSSPGNDMQSSYALYEITYTSAGMNLGLRYDFGNQRIAPYVAVMGGAGYIRYDDDLDAPEGPIGQNFTSLNAGGSAGITCQLSERVNMDIGMSVTKLFNLSESNDLPGLFLHPSLGIAFQAGK